jgi:hypothetical protein
MKRLAILIIGLGFVIRLFSFRYTYIINPDGALYIHQARAIYYGLNDSLTSCSLSFLSNYSIFIAGAYAILRDWVIAAKAVSLLFGSMTLIPIYFLVKRFFHDKIALLVTLILCLMPVFVARSAEVVRDPVYWFFSILGLYLFVSQLDQKNNLYLILASLSFLMAAWGRIEAVLFTLISSLYILFVQKEEKIKTVSLFILPLVLLALCFAAGLMFFNVSADDLYRTRQIAAKLSAPVVEYENLRRDLAELMGQTLNGNLSPFLHKTRNLVWLIALGTLLRYLVAAFFYPFFFVFIVGLGGIWRKIRADRRILYLALIAASALVLLYVHVVQTWMMFNRFMALFILPSFVFLGFGLEKVLVFFRSRFNLKESVALSIVCLLILAFSLPKNLKPRETDKLVFKRIGELIAEREGNDRETLLATSRESIRWISFYANANYKGAPCPQKNYDLENIMGNSYEEFVENLRGRGIRYFLWEENHWPKLSAQYISGQNPGDFVRVGEWSHADTGTLILFRVI